MKKLDKLHINSEKFMKNEELVTLRGGYGGHCCWCIDPNGFINAMAASSPTQCQDFCDMGPGWNYYWDSFDDSCIIA
jgi:hypothetical protein